MMQQSKRFSIRDMLLYTAALACGFGVVRSIDGGVYEFCLGMLTVFIFVGLVQQLLMPIPIHHQRWPGVLRRVSIGLILLCLAIAIFRAHRPHVVNDVYAFEQQEQFQDSVVAMPLWIFTLILGSLTARGMFHRVSSQSLESRKQRAIFFGATIGIVLLLIHVVASWGALPLLVDASLNGVKIGMQQGVTVGTSHYVEWFDRTPQQFNEFMPSQIWTWPPILFALMMAIGLSHSNGQSKLRLLGVFGLIIALAVPALLNAVQLVSWQARLVFPGFVDTYWEEPRPDLSMSVPPLLMVTLYLGTRRVSPLLTNRSSEESKPLCCDLSIVGWLFIVMGVVGLSELFGPLWKHVQYYRWPEFVYAVVIQLMSLFAAPEYRYPVLLLPYGLMWRYRCQSTAKYKEQRWPQIGSHQLLCFPLILCLLAASIALCLPFGFAILCVGL